ncbi:MAG TPA: hypothetical protein VG433_08350 [Pirellulales bacterium]|nr:hypothetical protein [Pirellulales bacterium]
MEGWYRILNIGYRFAALGACDYRFCRALGDCRTYVYHPKRPNSAEWVRGVVAGRSFFTTGPLVLLEVDGARPGDVIERRGSGTQSLRARVRLRSEVAPVTHAELVVTGRSVGRRWPLSSFVPGLLHRFDLPDVYRELGTKKLRQIEPWNADCKTQSS